MVIHPGRMPGRGTPHAAIRVDPAVWDAFRQACEEAGMDRSAALRAFIAWYLREPGAKLPERPGA